MNKNAKQPMHPDWDDVFSKMSPRKWTQESVCRRKFEICPLKSTNGMKYDKIMAEGNWENIMVRLKGYCAMLKLLYESAGASSVSEDAISGVLDLLEMICQDFQADIAFAGDYTAVFVLLAPFLVTLPESGWTNTSHAVHIPESPDKIHLFLRPVRGEAAALPVQSPRMITCFVHGSILPQFRPVGKAENCSRSL